MRFDVNRVRECYPALAEGYVHFDSAAGSLVAVESARAIAGVTGSAVGNKTTAFEPGRRALEITAAARSAVADLVGGVPDGVVFGQSATALTYLVSRTLAADWAPGDEVVVSRLDHDANVRPWLQAAARAGATVRWAEFDPATGELPVDQYEKLVTDRTRVVAVTAASNAIGTRPDVAAIAAIAHAAGALVYVDGVHATPHLPTDVGELGADFYVTSAYKWSGPHIAACVADPALWERLRPEKLNPAPDTVPERFEHGTLSFELLAGVTGAVDHLAGLLDHGPSRASRRERILASMAAVHAYEQGLLERLVTGLEGIDGVTMCPASRDRCPTVSFRVADQHPAQTSRLLAERRICVYDGDNYAFEYFDRMGLRDSGSAVRASIYHYTTEEDVQRLLDGVHAIR
ncbi:MAG TPA: cysteine desulfurase-like protein [Micromonosporaceae bacterium]|nr:cysteine desulfurase-like protein [Micromonosporaceae bacterium]